MPLGVLPFPTYEEVVGADGARRTLLLYTDGLVERPGEHLDDGPRAAGRLRARGARTTRSGCSTTCSTTLVPAGGRAGRRGAADAAQPPGARAASAPSSRPSRSRSRRSAACCGAGCSHAGADDWRSPRSPPPAARRRRTRSSTPARGTARASRCRGGATAREVEIAVRDHGSWRREREDDHGRGLDLMRTLMDTVAVEPGPEGTTVSLRRRLGQRGR